MADAAGGALALFAPCPRGLEDVLVEELAELGITGAHAVAGGVHAAGTLADSYRINLHSRIASRVLLRIAQGKYRSDEDIYKLARGQDWGAWFGPERSLRVDVTSGSGRARSPVKSIEFVTLRIKDAICDRLRAETGKRPDIDTRAPDVRVFAYLDADTCTLYLDTSGDALFKRGWRTETVEAPLRENLAAGILRLAGWKPGIALLDPMCGSGTFVVEAAQTALGIAPGARRRFGFEKLKNFDAALWDALRVAPAQTPAALDHGSLLLHASDVSGDAVVFTRANLERAGVAAETALAIAGKQIDARHIKPPAASGIMVVNPPYGERVGVRGAASTSTARDPDAETFFAEFGNTLKQRFAGWQCHILTSDMAFQKKLHLAPNRRVPLFNGAIECRLYRFDLVAGRPGAEAPTRAMP